METAEKGLGNLRPLRQYLDLLGFLFQLVELQQGLGLLLDDFLILRLHRLEDLRGRLGRSGSLGVEVPAAPQSPAQILQAMKAKNQEIIEKQTATLLKLDELEKEAEQIKVLAKRT